MASSKHVLSDGQELKSIIVSTFEKNKKEDPAPGWMDAGKRGLMSVFQAKGCRKARLDVSVPSQRVPESEA